jgi:predicted DNA-binding ribbon-helix-helix protein
MNGIPDVLLSAAWPPPQNLSNPPDLDPQTRFYTLRYGRLRLFKAPEPAESRLRPRLAAYTGFVRSYRLPHPNFSALLEIHVDLGLHLYRLGIQISRLVDPLPDSFQRRTDQQRMAADNLQVLYVPVLANDGA